MNKQNRQKVAKLVLNLGNGVGLLVFGLWAVLGTVLTALLAFTTSVVTLGLTAWPVTLLGLLVFWGPLFLGSALARKLGPKVQAWADREEVDPKAAKYLAFLEVERAKERDYAMEPSRKRL